MIIKECSSSIKSIDLFLAIASEKYPQFLDSNEGFANLGRYSIIAVNPFGIIKAKDGQVEVNLPNYNKIIIDDPFQVLNHLLQKYKVENTTDLPFIGGAIGYLSYDLVHHIENLTIHTEDDINIPDLFFCLYDGGVIFDHLYHKIYIVDSEIRNNSEKRIKWWKDHIQNAKKYKQPLNKRNSNKKVNLFQSNMSKQEYLENINRIKSYIQKGDIYQANFTQRFTTTLKEKPIELYLQLREKNPAPFAAYISSVDSTILSSSPERFIRLKNRLIETRPIKGTISRGSTPEEDIKNRNLLINSEKDKAELLMITDLERNDLGKVAKIGSVQVTELFKVEKYATVYHLVSTIQAVLDEHFDAIDLIKATFPGGSITGAPKIRAMEIIDELEPTTRNVYTGSIGYIDFSGNVDLNIVIRTIVIKNDIAYFQVGGGIVWDSDPEEEYNETLAKGKALFEVLK